MSNSSDPLISIIIPTYNHSRYLGRALQSIYDQTYRNWEAIIIDNHSTDDTCDVVKKFDTGISALQHYDPGGRVLKTRDVIERLVADLPIKFKRCLFCINITRIETKEPTVN